MLPELAQLFMGTVAQLQAATYHNLPAPLAITSCLYEGMQLPMDTALKVECKYFVKLNLDPVAGNIVKAFVALRPGYEAGPALHRELMAHARQRLGPAVAPREIDFAESLPKTRSGKIMRRLLRARELGLPEGDTSTLESY